MIKKNKGEWSELYALLKLLGMGRLYAADENTKRLEKVFFPIIKIIRKNKQLNKDVEYVPLKEKRVEIYINNTKIKSFTQELFEKEADLLLQEIREADEPSFALPEIEAFMKEIDCDRVVAPSGDKTDITMQVHDIQTGYQPYIGFSIKSELGSAPTLLNASGATNFLYKIEGISIDKMEKINALNNPRSKIMDRMKEISQNGTIKFKRVNNAKFASNLMMIDSRMEEMLSYILLYYYTNNVSDCYNVIQKIEELNPMNFPEKGFYEYKFKKFLCAVALGMKPSIKWNGRDEATGGYIIVTAEGEVLAYHIYNRDYFEEYLLKHTKFERASTSRHNYATLFPADDKMYMNLNLQIRFK